jgi:hypothetical protein
VGSAPPFRYRMPRKSSAVPTRAASTPTGARAGAGVLVGNVAPGKGRGRGTPPDDAQAPASPANAAIRSTAHAAADGAGLGRFPRHLIGIVTVYRSERRPPLPQSKYL